MDIKAIQDDIRSEWLQFEELMKEALWSKSDLLNSINTYLLDNKGKQVRPLLSLLAARALGNPGRLTIACSVVSEMIHTATLLHDDVADEATQRRGVDTVQYKYNPAASVLTGDYWLAKSLTLIVSERNMEVMGFFTKAVEELSEGELFQMQKASSLDTTEEDYYRIIAQKTSSLFIAAIKSSVFTMGATPEVLTKMEQYAYHLGLAFQIRDDIFDYTPQLNTGKPTGGDVKEKKLTLPLIAALKAAGEEERELMLDAIRFAGYEDDKLAEQAFALVEKYNGNAVAQSALEYQCNMAQECLMSLPDSIYRDHLVELTRYMGSREK
jgi:octaprenyl-diphosphate synthase